MISGFIFFKSEYPNPQRSITEPPKFSVTMSLTLISSLTSSLALGRVILSVQAFLPQFNPEYSALMVRLVFTLLKKLRVMSGRRLLSILITSAPITAIHWVTCGPAHTAVKSTILMPSNGSCCTLSISSFFRELLNRPLCPHCH